MTHSTDDANAVDLNASGRPVGDVWVRSTALGGSDLSRALRNGTTPDVWVSPSPRSVEDWRRHAMHVKNTVGVLSSRTGSSDGSTDREDGWLAALEPAFGASGVAARRLARAAGDGVVVTTGQQPGLFGGPSYTFSKAIAALALANELERSLGIPVAPVFWAATDDTDWAEAATTYFALRDGLKATSLVGPATVGVALADVPLGDLDAALRDLREASGSAANAVVLGEVTSAYVSHATIGDAYVQLLRAILEPLGIAVLDASHPSLRVAADPFLRNALKLSATVSASLAERTREIESAGFKPQVDSIDDLSLVFRSSIGASGRAQEKTRDRVPVADALRVAREAEQGTLGANVLLRPVLERYLLPTVAYCAGPGEFAYFAQVAPVAIALKAEQPVPVPRWSGEIIESRSMRALDTLQLKEEVLHDPHAAESLLARRATDEGVQDALERFRVTLEAQSQVIASAVGSADSLVSRKVVDGLSRDLAFRVDRFERRVTAAVKNREHELMNRIAYVRAAFRPLGSSPERVLNFLPALSRHGNIVLELMLEAATAHAAALVSGDNRDLHRQQGDELSSSYR